MARNASPWSAMSSGHTTPKKSAAGVGRSSFKVHKGNSMSKVQEKRSMSKTNFLMMKYERNKGYEMVFTVSKPNFGFGANLGQQLK